MLAHSEYIRSNMTTGETNGSINRNSAGINEPPRQLFGFQWETDADRFRQSLGERLGRFGLELHPDKTRRIEFGRYAELNRKRRGEGKPETFDFLGFTHISGKNVNGSYAVRRLTIRKRMRKKL